MLDYGEETQPWPPSYTGGLTLQRF